MKIQVKNEVVARSASVEPHPLWSASCKLIAKMLESKEAIIESKIIDYLTSIWGIQEAKVGMFTCGFLSSNGADQYATAMRFVEPILKKPGAKIITYNGAYMYAHGNVGDMAKSFADAMMHETEGDESHRRYVTRKISDALDRITRTKN